MQLVVENLGAERGGDPVFENIGFKLAQGEGLVVTGPNGAGKSTLLRVVAGLLPAMAGRVELHDSSRDHSKLSGACHYLGHLNGMKPALTVAENLRFWQSFLGKKSLAVPDALDRVGLGSIDHLPFAYLSTGQRRRVAIARLLVSHRTVWLLDEPTSGLDSAAQQRFTELLEEHLSGGGIIVAATHIALGLNTVGELVMKAGR